MKKLLLILGCLTVAQSAHADLEVVQEFENTALLSAYVSMSMVPSGQAMQAAWAQAQEQVQTNNTINTNALTLPQPQTEFSPGAVTKHQITTKLPMPFYLVGTDDQSVSWAIQNAAYLKSIHAMGMIVGATSSDQIQTIETKTGLTLMPGNVAGLSSIVGTNHYPFLVYQGWVSQ